MIKTILKSFLILLVTLGGFLADFYSKEWAEKNLRDKPVITLSKHFLDLGFTENRGMVFGMFNGKMSKFSSVIMVVIRLVILLGLTVFIWIKRKESLLFLLPFLLFWAGAIGNLVDSITKGYVVDFIHIHAGEILNWPFYFNLADAYVTIGMVLVIGYELVGIISKRSSVLATSR
jgi:signal peptidase II